MIAILTLKEVECCECHTTFAMTNELMSQKLSNRDGNSKASLFYCPQGHAQHFTGETEAQKLKRQLEYANKRADNNHQSYIGAERRARAQRGLVTRIKNRVKAGVCTDCNRSFNNLRRHMETKHTAIA